MGDTLKRVKNDIERGVWGRCYADVLFKLDE